MLICQYGFHLVYVEKITKYLHFSYFVYLFAIFLYVICVLAGYVEGPLTSPILCETTTATASQPNKKSLEKIHYKNPPARTCPATSTTVRGTAPIPTPLKKKPCVNKASKQAPFFSLYTPLTDQTTTRTGCLLGLRSYCYHEGS